MSFWKRHSIVANKVVSTIIFIYTLYTPYCTHCSYSHGRTALPALVLLAPVGTHSELVVHRGVRRTWRTVRRVHLPGGRDVVDPHEGGDDLVLLSDRGPRVVILLLFGELEESESLIVDTGDELVPASSATSSSSS